MSHKITTRHLKTSFKVIGDFFRKYRRQVTILLILNLIIAVGNATVPFITGRFFDALLNPEAVFNIGQYSIPLVLGILSILFLIQLILALIDYNNGYRSALITFLSRHDHQLKSYDRLLELPLAFHKKHKIGSIQGKITETGWGMQTLVGRLINQTGFTLISGLIALVVIFYIHPLMALFTLTGLLIFLIFSTLNLKHTAFAEHKFYQAFDIAYGDVYDSLANISAIKQAVSEEYERNKLRKNFIKRLQPLWMTSENIWRNLRFQQRIVIISVQLVVFIWSIKLVTDGIMSIGDLIAFNAYLTMVFGPFVEILDMSKTVQNALINIGNLEKLLSYPAEKYQPTNKKELKNINGKIKFDNVSFSYKRREPVLEDISFEIDPGQVVALVGESGVGKSTLINLLSAYYFPTKGKVLIDEINIRKLDLGFLRSQIAIVPQEVVLFNDTIKSNIKYGNFKAKDNQVKKAAEQAHALDFIEKFPKKWNQLVGERGVKLSVGQKQRIAITRAILKDPRILILDEPTSALDARSEKIIQKSLNELMKNRTTFIIAHRLSTVRKADLILVLEKGKIVEKGNHDQLIQKQDGTYRKLYELQIGLHE
ncbi:MAG: ABC transporter ATP-binding protein [Patescibacteria group bacterium]